MPKEAFLQKFWNNFIWNSDSRASVEDPSVPLSSKNIDTILMSAYQNESGTNITEENALTFAAVYRAVLLRGDTIGALPLHVYENTSSGKQIAADHPVNFRLSREPNINHTAFIYKQTSQGHQDLYGNSYSLIKWDGKGELLSLTPLDPTTVEVKQKGQALFYDVRETVNGKATSKVYPYNQILHIPSFGFNGLVGKGIVKIASESFGSALSQQKFGARFFKNNAQPSGILSSQNATDTQAKESKEAWRNQNSGTNTGGTAVLRGDWQYQTLTIPPEQAQFLQSRHFSVVEVARWFGVAPHLLFDLTKSSYNSIEQQSIEFAVYTIMGICKRWEQEMDRKLFSEEDRRANRYYTKFNVNALLRADIKSRGDWYRSMIQNGVMTLNEVRELEDMNALDGSDISFIQKNMQPVDMASELAQSQIDKTNGTN